MRAGLASLWQTSENKKKSARKQTCNKPGVSLWSNSQPWATQYRQERLNLLRVGDCNSFSDGLQYLVIILFSMSRQKIFKDDFKKISYRNLLLLLVIGEWSKIGKRILGILPLFLKLKPKIWLKPVAIPLVGFCSGFVGSVHENFGCPNQWW